jgi:hypothetical protein
LKTYAILKTRLKTKSLLNLFKTSTTSILAIQLKLLSLTPAAKVDENHVVNPAVSFQHFTHNLAVFTDKLPLLKLAAC